MSGAFAQDAVIIGAGPAGATAAIMLARAGRRPVVIEAKRFPRDKVCGGCLSGAATANLRRLLGDAAALPGVPAKSISFVIGSCRLTCSPRGRTRLVTRLELDARLAEAAADAGADMRYGEAASLERGENGWDVLAGGERWRGRHVLIASGISRLPQSVGIGGRPCNRALISQRWFQPVAGPLPRLGNVELHWLRGGYIGLATPQPDRCLVATAVEAHVVEGQAPLQRLRQLNPEAAILDTLAPRGPHGESGQGTAGFPWLPTELGRDNLLLVGDAAGYEEPYTGDGIGQAMVSGLCAARAILAGGPALPLYTALMRRHQRPGLRRTRLIGRMLRWGWVHHLASIRASQRFSGGLATLIEHVHVKGAS